MSGMWRDAGRPVRFLTFDGRSAIAILVFMVHISMATLMISVALMVFFWVIERFGYTVPNARRRARVLLMGNTKRAVAWWRVKKYRK